ncbi:hypothetical protein BS50DRAFT_154072 [Corynespora cassiicola Philippines]|uniref:Clr5 domain-containing protein n=1 Tax=Corynespora cassiicola Philippines TaxID=1448308 RepID=A0A2T2MZ88_CORCC|nr:hypothetical protein BS50DRAFT_154072 [Corynespora cassiicola Philippines]
MRKATLIMDVPPHSLPNLAPADLPQPEMLYTRHHQPFAQQSYGPYGANGVFASTLQAQFPGGQGTTAQNHILHSFSSSTVLPGHTQHDAEHSSNGQFWSAAPAEPVSHMGPPARLRKRKAPTLRAADWEPYKKRILDLHTGQNLPLPKVRQMIEEEYGFRAELRQYRTRISQWGKDKNIKPQEMEAIVRKRQKRKLVEVNKGPLVFEVRDSQVEPQKIERWMKRHKLHRLL